MSHDGEKFVVEEVIRHETGPSVVMNCATSSDDKHTYLVAGQESHCQLYNVQSVLVYDEIIENIDGQEQVKNRKQKQKENVDKNKNNSKKLSFVLKPGDSIQTDFNKEEPLQRVVRISSCGKYMATGMTKIKTKLKILYKMI